MTLQELLNSDVNSIGVWARQGLAWWLDELAALAPAWLRRALSAKPKHLAERLEDGGWRYWIDGRLAPDGGPARRAGGRVGLVLAPASVLTRSLTYPRLPLGDLRRMIALDLDRLSPVSADQVYHDVRVASRDEDGVQRVWLGLLPKAMAGEALQAASAEGLKPLRLGVALGDGATDYRFDFLPAIRRELGLRDETQARRWWWAAAGVLALANLVALVGRDMISVDRLRQAVDAQRPGVAAVMGVRRRVEAQERARGALIERGARGDPLPMLAALTAALPRTAWVQRLEWNGQQARIVGFRTGDADLLAALRASPGLANPRAAATATPAKAGAGQPFDITLDVGKKTH